MEKRIVSDRIEPGQMFSIGDFNTKQGTFITPCNFVHCNVTGKYNVYPDNNIPENKVLVSLVEGVTYPFSCWKITSETNTVILDDPLVVIWTR